MKNIILFITLLIAFSGNAMALTTTDTPQDYEPVNIPEAASVEERRVLVEVERERKELKKQYEARVEELESREAALKLLKFEVDKEVRTLEALKKDLSVLFKEKSEQEISRARELSRMYEKMDPAEAARVMPTLTIDLAVQVLSGMKDKKAGKVLGAMDPNAAATLTKAYSRFLEKKK